MSTVLATITNKTLGVITNEVVEVAVVSAGITINNGGGGGSDFYYYHNQPSALATWVINHNLGARPNVAAYTVGGVEVLAQVIHTSINQSQVIFDSALAGYAICS